MLRFILIVLITLFFGIPYLYEQSLATETKIIEMHGKKWVVTQEPGEEPMLKPYLEVPVINDNIEWHRETVEESKIVQTCDDPMGCQMTDEGDCPSCRIEYVKEKKVELVPSLSEEKTEDIDFIHFNEKLPEYLKYYAKLYRDINHPLWICVKPALLCKHGDTVKKSDLIKAKKNAEYCETVGRYNGRGFFKNIFERCDSSIINS